MLNGFLSGRRRVSLLQGEAKVSADRAVVLSTVLGSCVASCLFDPVAGIGGMNHFLLPEAPVGQGQGDSHYGSFLMALLVQQMLSGGARKDRLVAHLYGGANLRSGMKAIGTANSRFALAFLEREQIRLLHSDLGGSQARRLEFRPAAGQVRCRRVACPEASDRSKPSPCAVAEAFRNRQAKP